MKEGLSEEESDGFRCFVVLGLMGLLPGEAGASGLELRVGGFLPKADSILFADSITLYTVQKDDFNGWFGGGEFTANVHPNVELGLAIEGYAKEIPTVYRDYVRPSGKEIQQTLKLQTIPVSAIVRFLPAAAIAKSRPMWAGALPPASGVRGMGRLHRLRGQGPARLFRLVQI